MENRRSKMTRKIFQEALKETLTDHEITDLSVRQICQQAEMNRSTFYLHYDNLQDLLKETVNEFITHYPLENQYGIVEKKKIINSIKFIEENKIVFKKFINSGLLTEELITSLKCKFDKQLFWPHHTSIEPEHFMALMHYVVAGSNALLIYWVDNNSKISINELADLIIKLQASARDRLR